MRRAVTILFVILLGFAAANFVFVTLPASQRLAQDSRNGSVTIFAYWDWGIDPSRLVVDVWSVNPTAAMIDIDRALLEIASEFKGREFTDVYLASRGIKKFELSGKYFRTLGEEREWQNPVYTIRTLPENIYNLDGTRAFNVWTGGILGVMNKQMEDHKDFHIRWYINDM
jgi:hypothetical protein